MTNLDGVLKSREITLLTKVCLVKAMVFPVVIYGCESWIIKKAECRRIDAFQLRCWRRLWRVPWTAKRLKKSILKEVNPVCSLGRTDAEAGAPILFPLMWRADSLEKTLMLGKIDGKRRRERQKMRWLDDIINSMDLSLTELQEIGKNREAQHASVHWVAKSWTRLSDWTTTTTDSLSKVINRHSVEAAEFELRCSFHMRSAPPHSTLITDSAAETVHSCSPWDRGTQWDL